jgi:hypothetical protein
MSEHTTRIGPTKNDQQQQQYRPRHSKDYTQQEHFWMSTDGKHSLHFLKVKRLLHSIFASIFSNAANAEASFARFAIKQGYDAPHGDQSVRRNTATPFTLKGFQR